MMPFLDDMEIAQRTAGRPLTVGEAYEIMGADAWERTGFGIVPEEEAISLELRRIVNEVNDTPVEYDDIVAAQVAQERAAVARRAAETEDLPPAAPDEDPFAGFDPDSLPEDLTVAMREVDASGREVVRNSSAREVVNRLQAFEEYLRCRLG
jgi:hypothetical protein